MTPHPAYTPATRLLRNAQITAQVLKALRVPRQDILRVNVDRELDITIDTTHGTLHAVHAEQPTLVSADINQHESSPGHIRVITSHDEYAALHVPLLPLEEGEVSFTPGEYLQLLTPLNHFRRRNGQRLHVLAAALLLPAALAAYLVLAARLSPAMAATAALATYLALNIAAQAALPALLPRLPQQVSCLLMRSGVVQTDWNAPPSLPGAAQLNDLLRRYEPQP